MSLFDELEEAAASENEYNQIAATENNSQPDAANEEASVHQKRKDGADSQPVTAADLHLSSRTPLARYMAQLSGEPAEEEAASPPESTEELTNDAQNESDTPHTATPPHPSPESTSSRFFLILRIAFEVISPLLSLLILPRSTLLSQSDRWITHTCFRTGELLQLDATTGTAAGLVAHITSTRLHLTKQVQQLRNLYILALIFSAIPSIAFLFQFGLTLFTELYRLSLQIVIGSSTSAAQSPSEFNWSNLIWSGFLLSSIPDFIIALVSERK